MSCGIPDFRSESGIYNNLDIAKLGVGEAQEVFSIQVGARVGTSNCYGISNSLTFECQKPQLPQTFNDDPSIFYKCAANLFDNYNPSDTHRFMKWLEDEGRLLRIYT